jgi:hypothetical protein
MVLLVCLVISPGVDMAQSPWVHYQNRHMTISTHGEIAMARRAQPLAIS